MDEPTTRAAKRAATAQRILEAAQVEFGDHGLEGTTVRAIAQRAGVDPSLVIQHYGSKNDLFALAARLDRQSTDHDVAGHLFDVLDVRLNALPPETRALVRSMLTAPEAAQAMKNFLDERVRNLARTSDDGDAELRAALTVSSILGLTIARHFLQLDALADISESQIETVLRPWLTNALGGEE
ncbi:transcriptional regulator, TetR family [Streptomyces sp. 2224.1]|uniref:TetR/AcrR family transcriptional regulator n=1 Tax=unclassified Streptomyces TaxID=2593676 RepID=UPI000887FC30|nr:MULTISPECIES: TetR/AcrR family transcriptional regulator [unclassified Streptomyces]PBC82895.1 TetR family transcriptional regulator [Streptomyces sp. 2321.6]SDR46426.1 transcriptional regulator, TetR family [Streptomyces sp. KS_16]SEC28754.1 transcriptional regulator, TetR family [Streptomyces sp. 2224.1]SEC75886.1 transcriptional regulator, TetR family [Streptomyces sp. 2133.1]SEE90254.1 transcriptional regulator, TetR family [Streptomyces sp. 2112.3]